MHITIFDKRDFYETFLTWHGGMHKKAFSRRACEAIFDRLTSSPEYYSATQVEIDIVSIRLDYQELTESKIRKHYQLNQKVNIEDFLGKVTTWWKKTTKKSYVFTKPLCSNGININVDKGQFHAAFFTWQGGEFRDAFSFEGREELYDHLKYIENKTGIKLELDLLALATDYNELTESQIRLYYKLTDDVKIEDFLGKMTDWWKETTPGRYVFNDL